MSREIRLAKVYPYPPERLWRALTDPKELAEWLMPNDLQPVPGHRFRFNAGLQRGWRGFVDCEVLEVDPPRLLSYKISPAVGGRFLLEEYSGAPFGVPVKGLRLTGYDNAGKEYESTWTFSLSTGMMPLTGPEKDGGKTIEWSEAPAREGGGKKKLFALTRFLDDDRFALELLATNAEGKTRVMIETTYIRKK